MKVEVLTGPMMVACHWNILSPVGPAEHEDGGSRPRSINSCRGEVLVLGQKNEASGTLEGTWPQSVMEQENVQRSNDETTNLVNALESHCYNKMLYESYDRKSERNRAKS